MSSTTLKIRTSWQLLCQSLLVLRRQPKLYLFPVVNAVCVCAFALVFLSPVMVLAFAHWGGGQTWSRADWQHLSEQYSSMVYVYGAVIYLVSMVVATFMNVAFYHEILHALSGAPVSVRGGLRFAATRWQAIMLWSLLAATVGLIIRAIEERLGFIGRLVMGFIGMAWSVAAVFTIPVLIRRTDNNPVAVLRDSVGTLKRTWGETLAGFVGIKLGGLMFLALTAGLLVPAAVIALWLQQGWIGIVAFAIWLLAAIVTAILLNMATHVYRCALYVYASEGVVPDCYTPEMMSAAWKVKKA